MAYSPMGVPFRLTSEEMGAPNYMDALTKGLMGAQMAADTVMKPHALAEQLLAAQLGNRIKKAEADIAPEMQRATLQEKLSAAARAHQLATQPYGGMLSGIGKEAYGIAQMTGQDPAEVAKKLYENKLAQASILNTYRQGLTESMPTKILSPFGKISKEEEDVSAGFEPGTNRSQPMELERQQELLGQYGLLRQKASTDADTRKKTLLASNIEKTIATIEPKDLTKFAGIGGQLQLHAEQAKAASNPGTESADYRKYTQAAQSAEFLAHQVRQFYGDSIQPAMLQKLEKITNPATWKNNPKIALDLYKSFTDLLKRESGTYTGGLKSTKEYESQADKSETVKMYKNGRSHTIPKTEAKEAESMGYSYE